VCVKVVVVVRRRKGARPRAADLAARGEKVRKVEAKEEGKGSEAVVPAKATISVANGFPSLQRRAHGKRTKLARKLKVI